MEQNMVSNNSEFLRYGPINQRPELNRCNYASGMEIKDIFNCSVNGSALANIGKGVS